MPTSVPTLPADAPKSPSLHLVPPGRRIGQASRWDTAIADVLADPARVSVVYQPIADVRQGVVAGFESLARFQSDLPASPDVWFHEAERRGKGLALEACVVGRALESLASVPPNCFLSVNVSPTLLLSPEWGRLVSAYGNLSSVVVEVTENLAITDYRSARQAIERIRAAGGAFAVDDAGAGFASLNHVVALRPDFVKLDRVFVSGCDTDPAKRALIEMMGGLAGQLDAWIIAEGVETLQELQTLSHLRVPLAQGFLLAKPQPGWTPVDAACADQLRAWRQALDASRTIASLCERARALRDDHRTLEVLQTVSPAEVIVLVNDRNRPTALVGTDCGHQRELMKVKATSPAEDVLKRAMTRPAALRFSPLVVVDDLGAFEGIVRCERLIEFVAFRKDEPPALQRASA